MRVFALLLFSTLAAALVPPQPAALGASTFSLGDFTIEALKMGAQ